MFCHKCGAQVEDFSKFCHKCGAQRPDTESPSPSEPKITYAEPSYTAPGQTDSSYDPRPPYGSQPETGPEPVKSKKPWKILIPACVVLIAAVCAGIYLILNATPSSSLGKALSGLGAEMGDRLNTTPLKAFSILADSLENGQISVDFDYVDYWGDGTSGNVTAQFNAGKRDYAVLADISTSGLNIDLDAYINAERAAIKSTLLDSNYYGFEYATFRSDIAGFGELIGLDDYTMSMISDYVEALGELVNTEAAKANVNDAYSKVLSDFITGLDQTSSKAPLPSGNSSDTYQKIDYVITKQALLKLLNDYYDIMKDDTTILDQLESYGDTLSKFGADVYNGGMYPFGMDYSNLLSGFEELIDIIDREYEGVTTLSFYLDGNRLVCLSIQYEMEISGETATINVVCDFGAQPASPWLITMTVSSDDGDEMTASITWDYRESGNQYVNELIFSSDDGYYEEMFSLKSTWSKTTGDFTLSYTGDYDEGELSGRFMETADGFDLKFDNLLGEYTDEELSLGITVSKGVKIDDPPYISLKKWDENLLFKLEEMVYSLTY